MAEWTVFHKNKESGHESSCSKAVSESGTIYYADVAEYPRREMDKYPSYKVGKDDGHVQKLTPCNASGVDCVCIDNM
jgi:hypothetical protein